MLASYLQIYQHFCNSSKLTNNQNDTNLDKNKRNNDDFTQVMPICQLNRGYYTSAKCFYM